MLNIVGEAAISAHAILAEPGDPHLHLYGKREAREGRKTFESLPGLLPGRRHIVLTRRESWASEGAEVAGTRDKALELAAQGTPDMIPVVGGAAIYDTFRPLADRIEVTEIHRDYPGDTFMKPLGPEWVERSREDFAEEGERPAFSFVTYTRAD
jgi:dihydrofolate reductase